MSKAARVVVVMPVINEERHLRDSVLRLLEQDYQGPLDIVIAVEWTIKGHSTL